MSADPPQTPTRDSPARTKAGLNSPSSKDSPSREAYTSLTSLMNDSPTAGVGRKASKSKMNQNASGQDFGGEGVAVRSTSPGAMGARQRKPDGGNGGKFHIGGDSSRDRAGDGYGALSEAGGATKKKKKKAKAAKKSTWDLIALTISMGGSQIAWVVELGYGTPYLLSLGLSEELTSLVWLAGPISGLIAQPLIGAISDSSLSKYRRRYWIVASTVVLVISGLMLAFTEAIAELLVDMFQGGVADWDPRRAKLIQTVAISIAVIAFYALDFALNALQGSLRNLVLDITPGEQLQAASAWHGRFGHIGNVVGFAVGSLNLANVPILRDVGGGQFRRLCIVAILFMVVTVFITAWTQEEEEREPEIGQKKSKFKDIFITIYEAVTHLPKPVRRVCYVQICAFMGWFPYLFYSTTWVTEVMATELGREPNIDDATRAGSLALLIYSCVAIVAGTVLPYLSARDHRLLAPDSSDKSRSGDDEDSDDEDDKELAQIREMVKQWKAEAARDGKPLKLPTMPFMLRNIWTSALLLFGVLMFTTVFINRVWQATIMIALVGICWAVACWVPFAIIMEFLKEIDDRSSDSKPSPAAAVAHRNDMPPRPRSVSPSSSRPFHGRAVSTPAYNFPGGAGAPTERTALVRSMSTADIEGINEQVEYGGSKPAGGTIMGIHNLAIVFPQFLIAIISSFIFKLADGSTDGLPKHHHAQTSGVAWTLRFGGLMAIIGALICRRVAPTKTEKAMRRRLAEMREESEDINV